MRPTIAILTLIVMTTFHLVATATEKCEQEYRACIAPVDQAISQCMDQCGANDWEWDEESVCGDRCEEHSSAAGSQCATQESICKHRAMERMSEAAPKSPSPSQAGSVCDEVEFLLAKSQEYFRPITIESSCQYFDYGGKVCASSKPLPNASECTIMDDPGSASYRCDWEYSGSSQRAAATFKGLRDKLRACSFMTSNWLKFGEGNLVYETPGSSNTLRLNYNQEESSSSLQVILCKNGVSFVKSCK